jgi:hypothetical protein
MAAEPGIGPMASVIVLSSAPGARHSRIIALAISP